MKTILPPVRRKWRPPLAMVVGLVLAIVLALPIAGMAAVVILSRSPDQLVASLVANAPRILAAGTVILAVTAIVGFLFWRLVSKPVYELIGWTETVGARAAMPMEATHHGTRELATLASSFSSMVAKLNERSDYIETFTAHVSHELKSPLTAIAGAAELMRDAGDDMDASARSRFLDNIVRDTARLSALVGQMREMARAETAMAVGSADLSGLAAALRERFPMLTVQFEDGIVSLPLPQDDALAVLSHLADNAARHGANRLEMRMVSRENEVILTASNDGEPISAGNRTRIFDPFYTTHRETGGTGMGLPIVRAMLKAHGGDITLAEEAEGVAFRIVLPR